MFIRPRVDALSAYCKEHNVSRSELARRMNVDPHTAYRVDAGKVLPSPTFIAGLIKVTGRKFEDLFEIVDAA